MSEPCFFSGRKRKSGSYDSIDATMSEKDKMLREKELEVMLTLKYIVSFHFIMCIEQMLPF